MVSLSTCNYSNDVSLAIAAITTLGRGRERERESERDCVRARFPSDFRPVSNIMDITVWKSDIHSIHRPDEEIMALIRQYYDNKTI